MIAAQMLRWDTQRGILGTHYRVDVLPWILSEKKLIVHTRERGHVQEQTSRKG